MTDPGYHTCMPETTETVAYICECGKKWIVQKAELKDDHDWRCKCGRTVLVYHGAMFSTVRK